MGRDDGPRAARENDGAWMARSAVWGHVECLYSAGCPMTLLDRINAAEDSLRTAKTHLRLATERGDREQLHVCAADLASAAKHVIDALRIIGGAL